MTSTKRISGADGWSLLNILEIGLGVRGEQWDAKVVHGRNEAGGASVRMWSEYFPNATIYGLDINEAKHLDSGRVRTFVVDQGDRAAIAQFARSCGATFDIIIDDGSHRPDHQQVTLECLFPSLNPNGLYFIEDLSDRGVGERAGSRHGSATAVPTRRLFVHYISTGELITPNAFTDARFLEDVSDVAFHSPKPLMRPRDVAIEFLRVLLGRSKRGILREEYVPGSHKLLMLRKKASA